MENPKCRPSHSSPLSLPDEYKSILEEVGQHDIKVCSINSFHFVTFVFHLHIIALLQEDQAAHDLCAAAAAMRSMNPEEFITCEGSAYPTLEQTIESFNSDEIGDQAEEDSAGPIYNYEWVDEVMQALNVSPDISNAFHVCNL